MENKRESMEQNRSNRCALLGSITGKRKRAVKERLSTVSAPKGTLPHGKLPHYSYFLKQVKLLS
ncbi:MAG: hypothetical protein V4733_10445, partial [Verrucomicrobiota bacterium]